MTTWFERGSVGQLPKLQQYGYNLGVATSQFIATALYGKAPDVSISGAAGRAAQAGNEAFINVICPVLDTLFGEGHCADSIEPDESYAQQVWDWTNAKLWQLVLVSLLGILGFIAGIVFIGWLV